MNLFVFKLLVDFCLLIFWQDEVLCLSKRNRVTQNVKGETLNASGGKRTQLKPALTCSYLFTYSYVV